MPSSGDNFGDEVTTSEKLVSLQSRAGEILLASLPLEPSLALPPSSLNSTHEDDLVNHERCVDNDIDSMLHFQGHVLDEHKFETKSSRWSSFTMGDSGSIGERDLRRFSSYFSAISNRTSMRTFLTARSRQTSNSHNSTVSYNSEFRTPWQHTLSEKNLTVSKFDETNWSGRGQHAEFGRMEGARIDSILVPQGSQGVLGHSNTAFVERVRCKRIMLARKRIRCVYPIKREEMIEEVAHLQRLSHAHVVRGVGTYVFKKELSILLYPATKYNLETFLDEYMELSADFYKSLSASQHVLSQMRAGLGKSIKCLVNTIAYIHENLVKHMDIKPTNILVQEKVRANEVDYKIYLADFGIARSYQTAAEVETDSATSFTRAYAAPEVFWQDIRGFPADIFSLGCVLIEIEAVLADKHDDLLAMRRRNRQGDLTYHANLFVLFSNGIPEGCCLNGLDILISEYWDALRAMLSLDPALRPTASNLQATFGTDMPCCSLGPEPFEAATPLAPNSRAMETLPE